MRKPYWIGFALTLMILLGAFCLPWLLLRMEQRRAEKQVLTVTEDAQLSTAQLSLTKKQLMLAKDEFLIWHETEPDSEECRRLIDSALKELKILQRSGAIYESSYLVAEAADLEVRQCVAFCRENVTVFRFYSLSDSGGLVSLCLDVDTEKILRVSYMEAWEQAEEMRSDVSKGEASYEGELLAWAQYYGLKLEGVRQRHEDVTIIRQEAVLSDDDGQRFVFCKLYNDENGGLGWQSVPETTFDIADMIQQGLEEDTNMD